jgi:hypothetical protein
MPMVVWALLVPAATLGGIMAFGAAALARDALSQRCAWLALGAFALAAIGAALTARGARAGPWVLVAASLLYAVATVGLLQAVSLAPTPAVEPPARFPDRDDLLEGLAVQLGVPLILLALATTLAFRARRAARE